MAQKSIIKRIISSPLIQTSLIYISGGYCLLELTEYICDNYGLSDRTMDVVGIILLIGLPFAIYIAWHVSKEAAEETTSSEVGIVNGSMGKIKKRHLYTSTLSAVFIICLALYFLWIKSDLPAYNRANLELRSQKAGEKAKKARTLKNDRAHALYIYASYEGNDYIVPPEIVDEYHKLLDTHPDSPEAHLYLGEIYYFSWENPVLRDPILLDSAWILINQAQDMGMKSFDADNLKMFLLRDLGLDRHVKECAEMLVLDYPEEPAAWINSGTVFLRQLYDTIQAIEYYQKALDIYPRSIDALTGLADIYIAQQEYDLAMDFLNASLKINPNYWKIADSYLSLFENSGRFNEAATFFEGIIEKYNIEFIDYNRLLAYIYIMNNDTLKARAFIDASLDQYPGDYNLLSRRNELRQIIRYEAEGTDINVNQYVTWFEDFEDALAKAKNENKPILAQFYGHKNNYLFQRMNREIFSESSIQAILNEFVPVRLSESNNPGLFKEYGIDYAYYDLKIISTDRVVLENIDPYIMYPEICLSLLSQGLEKHKRYQLGRKLNTESFTEVSNFDDAKLISEARKFPIMVVIFSETSPYSQRLLNETLKDPMFKSEFNNIVYFNISPEGNQNLIESWKVKIFPSLLFLDSTGDIIHRCYGYKTPESLAAIVRKVKETYSEGVVYAPEINWLFNLEEAMIAAQIEQKYIFMAPKYFRNRPNVINEPEVINKLGDYICLSIEDVRNLELVSQYGRLYNSVCLILDPSGNEKLKSVGLFEKEKLLKWLDIEQEMIKMSLIGPEKYMNYRDQIDIAEAMGSFLPRSAINIYKAQLEVFPDDHDIIQKLGGLYLQLKDAGAAIKYFQMEAENNPDYGDFVLENMIASYLQLDKHQELKEWFDDQIKANEGNKAKEARLYRYYSELCEILMDSVKAREYAFRAIQINPDNFESYTHLGRLLYYLGDYNMAKRYLLIATKSEVETIIAYPYLALIAEDLQQIGDKERYLNLAFRHPSFSPNNILNNYLNRSKFYLYPGYTLLIKKNLSDRMRIAPNDIYYKYEYSQFLVDYGNDLEMALQLIDECIRARPEAFVLQEIKAWIHYRLEQVPEADSCITLYLQNVGDRFIDASLSALYHTGKIKLAAGDTVQGIEYLRKAQKIRDITPMEEFMEEDIRSILKEAS